MSNKTSQTDIKKRLELFYEFLYFVFDSLLIPLIRSNFYVTESNTRKYQLFFFRHDVWRYVAEPAMSSLKLKMFEEVNMDDARQILGSRILGFSQVRLLPKETTMRPIMNLRRRTLVRGSQKELGPAINKLLAPVQSVLQLEAVSPLPPPIFLVVLGLTRIVYKSRDTRLCYVLGGRYLRAYKTIQEQAGSALTKALFRQN